MDKYNTIWGNICVNIKIKLNRKPVYNKILLKTETKSYTDEAADFHDKEVSIVGSSYTFLAVISFDGIFEID